MNTRILLVVATVALGAVAVRASDDQPASRNPDRAAPAERETGSTRGSYLQASGFPSVHQDTPSDKLLMSEARSVRRALNENRDTSRENVQVIIDRGRIVLRGTVSSAAARRKVEKAANAAISNRDVVSQLQVPREDRR